MHATCSLNTFQPSWSTKPSPRSQHAREAFKAGNDSDDAVVDDRNTSMNLARISSSDTTPVKSSSQDSKTRQPPRSKTSFTWRTARPQRGVNGIGGGGGASLCDDAVCPMGASALFGGRGCGAFVRLIAGGAGAASGWRCVGFAPRARLFLALLAGGPSQRPARYRASRRPCAQCVAASPVARTRRTAADSSASIPCAAALLSGGHFGVL